LASVSFKNLKFRLVGEVVSHQNFSAFKDKIVLLKSQVSREPDSVPIIVAPYLSAERRKHCQQARVCFLDMCGNMFLAYQSLYIERVGYPNRFPEKRKGRSPFSDKASLILRVLIKHNQKVWGIRELAESVHLDPGFVSRVAKELEERNYVVRLNSKLKLNELKDILEDWVREYDYKRNEEKGYFCLAKSPDEIIQRLRDSEIPEEIQYALGFHAGASLVAPYAVFSQVHVYIPDERSLNVVKKRLNLREVNEGANVVFVFPYYRESVFYDKQNVNGLWVVSDLQLYLDLYSYPIRGIEQAEHIFEKRLSKKIEGGIPNA
jgi:hypothetical protein